MLQRLKEELVIQKQRYCKTKYGKIVALLIYCLLLKGIPMLLKSCVPQLLKIYSQQTALLIIMFITVTSVSTLCVIALLFIYRAKLPFFESYRVNPKRPWPWQQKSQTQWKTLLNRSLIFNFMYVYIVPTVLLYIGVNLQFNFDLQMKNVPSIWQLIKYLLFLHFFEDFFFFLTHRLLHTPFFYKYIHKVHHEYKTTVSITALHSHPLQVLITNTLPPKIYLDVMVYLFGPMHITTIVIWMILRMYDAYNAHCGYTFSWSPVQLLPFCTNDDFHDFHHSHNIGNYSAMFRIWDITFDSSKDFREHKSKKGRQQSKDK